MILNLLLLCMTASCAAAGSLDVPEQPEPEKNPSEMTIREILQENYKPGTFWIGASGIKGYFLNPSSPIAQTFFKEMPYNTPTNSFKHSTVFPQNIGSGQWNAGEYRFFIDQARKTGQVIRCHGPIAPQCNRWAREEGRTAAELEQSLTSYLTTLSRDLQANKDVVKWMDVVNETICNSNRRGTGYDGKSGQNDVVYPTGGWMGPLLGTEAWENPWTIIGMDTVAFEGGQYVIPKYIEMAFRIAQENAPDIQKVWNEQNLTQPKKFENFKKAFRYIRSKGITIDAVAFQGHIPLGWEKSPENLRNLENVILWCKQNDVKFHISELNVKVNNKDVFDRQALEQTRQEQTDTYMAFLELVLEYAGDGVEGINFWTFTDHCYKGNFAGLFDINGNPNPVFSRLKELLRNKK